MTEIAASPLGTRLEANVLALKLQLQREAEAATTLVEQAVRPTEATAAPSTGNGRLADVLV